MTDPTPVAIGSRSHRLARMTGRDPREGHRPATPLELLFDLTFVVAFGLAADQFAHLIAGGHWQSGVLGMLFAVGGICWAWINFSWFASAYDTDDWFYRVTTMVQMIAVVVFALGLAPWFHSLEAGGDIDNEVSLGGYVIMRVAMIAQWLRAARQDPSRRRTALAYAFFVGAAQIVWVILTVVHQSVLQFFVFAVLLFVVEAVGPVLAERKSEGTPWHPGHIAERHGLLAIIALGEVIFGTVTAVAVLVEKQGWSLEAGLVVVAGIGITFGLWWLYFAMPSGEILARHRDRMRVWGYGHMLLYGSIASTGAGLHVAAFVIEGDSEVGVLGAIVSIVIPVLIFALALFGIYSHLVRDVDRLHLALLCATVALLVLAVVLAAAGVSIEPCLLIVTLAPAVSVVGFETVGYRHQEAVLARVLAEP